MPSPTAQRIEKEIASLHLRNGEHLIRYGKVQHLTEMVDEDKLYLRPASSYDDPSLNLAQKDRELERGGEALSDQVSVSESGSGRELANIQPSEGRVKLNFKARLDYYVYCVSTEFSCRTFDDFEADSCVAIQHPVSFYDALKNALYGRFPDWQGLFSDPITYYDSSDLRLKTLEALGTGRHIFQKDSSFDYQKEYRFAFVPSAETPPTNLQPVTLDIPGLAGFCKLIA